MEVATREEVHLLVYFDALAALADFQALVDGALSADPNVPDVFGRQLVYDADDEIVDVDDRLRQVGTALGLERMVVEVKARDGVAIPAHVFRHKFSLWSQLGFVSPDAGFDAVEVGRAAWMKGEYKLGDRVEGYPVVTGSDAHFLEDVGRIGLDLTETVTDIHALVGALQAGARR